MKNRLVVFAILSLVLVILLPACSSQAPAPKSSAPAPAASVAPKTAAAPASTTAAPAGKVFKLKFSTWTTPTGPFSKSPKFFLSQLEMKSERRVQFEQYWGGTLIPQPQELDGMKSGLADMVLLSSAYFVDRLPLWAVTCLPGIPTDVRSASAAQIDLAAMPALESEFAKWNMVFVGPSASARKDTFVRKEVSSLADFKGMKVRAQGPEAKLAQSLGASVVAIGSTETYEGMQKGTVDAVIMAQSGGVSWKLQEVSKCLVETNFGLPSFGYFMKTETWNALPDDIKKIIKQTAKEELPSMLYYYYVGEGNAEGIEVQFPKYGVKVVKLNAQDQAKLVTLGKPLVDEWLATTNSKGLSGQPVLDQWVKLNKKYETFYGLP